MSEAGRGEAAHAHDAASDAHRDAKIEQLLLVGLDHYFAARFDQAIHVWTRALFLDRSHQRARAYIERARSALAERQRQSEELLHSGVDAFSRGESDEARRLLRAAIDGGAPPDEALALLDRIDRLDSGAAGPSTASPRSTAHGASPHSSPKRSRSAAVATLIVLVGGVLAFGGYAAVARHTLNWRTLLMLDDPPAQTMATPVVREQSLPPPRRGELALGRARSLAAGGHLSDALAMLDQVRPTDAQKIEADQLRAELQRQLLAVSTGVHHVP